MFKRRELIYAFDIEDDLIKMAQVATDDSGLALLKLSAEPAKTDNPGEAVKALRKLIGVKPASARIVVNLPRHKVTVKKFKLPSSNPSEIENMVTLQAAKQLPFSPDRIISGHKIMGVDREGYSEVMVSLAHRDMVDGILNVFNDVGLDTEKLSLSSEAIGLWYLQRQKEEERRFRVIVVDVGSLAIEVLVVYNGRVDFTRSVKLPKEPGTQERIADEIEKSIFTYTREEPGAEIAKLVLTGRRSVVKEEAPALKKRFGLPTVYVDALKSYRALNNAALPDEEVLRQRSFTAALSLGFNCDALETNLIPHQMRLDRMGRIVKGRLIFTTALFLLILVGAIGVVSWNFIDKHRYLATINAKLDEMEPKVAEIVRLKELTEAIKAQSRLEGSAIDILRDLYGRIPPEITLTIFDYEDGRSCLLRGTSGKLSDVFKFISVLEDSTYFENVKVKYATKRVVRGKELTDFEINCLLPASSSDE